MLTSSINDCVISATWVEKNCRFRPAVAVTVPQWKLICSTAFDVSSTKAILR